MPLKRRPHPHVAVTNDGEHTEQSKAERSDSPYRSVARKISCIVFSAPLLFHGTPPVPASAKRCGGLLKLLCSDRLTSCCIASAVSVRPWDTAKWMFSRMVRSANTSARTVCSPVFGLVALSRTSRTHSLMVCSPARASNRAYSSSVTLVLIDLVRREGMEFTPSNQQVPIREPKVTARRSDGRGSRQAAEFSASSHIATKVAIRHPFGGDVSVQLPVPKAPLCSWSARGRRCGHLAASGSATTAKQKSITAHRIPMSAHPMPCVFPGVPTRGETEHARLATPSRRSQK